MHQKCVVLLFFINYLILIYVHFYVAFSSELLQFVQKRRHYAFMLKRNGIQKKRTSDPFELQDLLRGYKEYDGFCFKAVGDSIHK